MKAVILSAGQGSRLLPFTSSMPKCILCLGDRSLIEWQIDALKENGIHDIVVVTGYKADKVSGLLEHRYGRGRIRTVFNPFFDLADNLASCWMVREEMDGDFLLLNGDTLFEPGVVERLLNAPLQPITLARDVKSHYDADDMKLRLKGDRLLAIGKDLPLDRVHGESIGMIRFLAEGVCRFRTTLEGLMYDPASLKRWYLSVIGQIAAEQDCVWTCSVHGLGWAEIDYPLDLKHAQVLVAGWGWGTAEETAASA